MNKKKRRRRKKIRIKKTRKKIKRARKIKKDKKKDKNDKNGKKDKKKDKSKTKDKKGKKDKKDKKDKKKDKSKKKDKKHKKDKKKDMKYNKKEKETKVLNEGKMELIRKWLDAGKDSVAQYAPVSQVVINLGEPTQEHRQLVDAATYQYQAEECYTQLLAGIKACKNDKICLKSYSQLNSSCERFAKNAHDILANIQQSEL